MKANRQDAGTARERSGFSEEVPEQNSARYAANETWRQQRPMGPLNRSNLAPIAEKATHRAGPDSNRAGGVGGNGIEPEPDQRGE